MKSIILCTVVIFLWRTGVAQNLIDNPSFETPGIANDYPTADAQFSKLSRWQSRTYTVSGGADLHSPDWLKVGWYSQDVYGNDIDPKSGSCVVFTSPEEIIQQNLSSALNEGLYNFSANVILFSTGGAGYAFNNSHDYYFRLRFAKTEMTYESEEDKIDSDNCTEDYRNLSGNDMVEMLVPIKKNLVDQWQKIEINNIKFFDFGYDWIGFDMVVYNDGEERVCTWIGIHVDDVSLSRDCCGDWMAYQAVSNKLPRLTQRNRYIQAGYDVNADNMAQGPVTVLEDSFVKFKAGDFLALEPGFNVELGGNFVAEIGSCGSESDPNYNFKIALDYVNQCAYLNCSSPYVQPPSGSCFGTNTAFYSNGGGWYWVIIKNNLGQIIFEDMASIHSIIQDYWNGAHSAVFTNLQGVAEVNIGIYNCQNLLVDDYTVTYHYINGCTPTPKKEQEDVSLSSENIEESQIILFPNPFTDEINIRNRTSLEKLDIPGLNYVVTNSFSQKIKAGFTDEKISLHNISSGTYYISVFTADKNFGNFKIIKQ